MDTIAASKKKGHLLVVTGKSRINKSLRCITPTKGKIEMIEEKTGVHNGLTLRELVERYWCGFPHPCSV
jgi:hypothetical protein